ncbi:MAG: ABC transporter permease [Thermoleophilia bacterium]|nr:ABC transporter permease [Thermoleophilia bacterium]
MTATELEAPELVLVDVPSRRRRHPLVGFVLRRVAAGIATLFVVSILLFAGTNVLPGDVASAVLGRDSTPAGLAQIRKELDLNRPASERYWSWLSGFVQGDLGSSVASQAVSGEPTPISGLIGDRIRNTATLALCTVLLLVPLSIFFGVLSATRAGSPVDHAVTGISLGLISLPEFVTGTLLVLLLAQWLGLLPAVSLIAIGASVFTHPSILVLPVLTLLAASLAQTTRMVRAGMLEVLRSDYVEWARLSGHRERDVVFRYALRNALAPTVQVIALNVQWLVGGIVVTEYVFGYPGIGQALVQAVSARDVPYVLSVGMLIAIVYIALNVLADLLVVLLVPKLRTAQ